MKMSILPKLIYRLNAMPICFLYTDKITVKFIWKGKVT